MTHISWPPHVRAEIEANLRRARDLTLRLNWYRVAFVALAVFLVAAWAFALHERGVGARRERVKVLVHKKVILDSVFVLDRAAAAKAIGAYAAARRARSVVPFAAAGDTTAYVPRGVADNAINACTAALNDCDRLRAVNDSIVRAQDAERPRGIRRLLDKVGKPVAFVAGLLVGARIR